MKKFVIQGLIIALLAYLLELFFPWWSIVVAAALGGLFLRSKRNFWAGFLGIGGFWLTAVLIIDFSSPSGLAQKVGAVFGMNEFFLIVVTCLIGATIGGLGALTGSYMTRKK